jgi:PAS domain-containing protein
MIFTDLDDRIIAVNDAFCEMVGFSREELIGQDSRSSPTPRTSASPRRPCDASPTGEGDQDRATSSATCARTVG